MHKSCKRRKEIWRRGHVTQLLNVYISIRAHNREIHHNHGAIIKIIRKQREMAAFFF